MISGDTAQRQAYILLASLSPYRPRILGNTQSIPCGFEPTCQKLWLRNLHTGRHVEPLKRKDIFNISKKKVRK